MQIAGTCARTRTMRQIQQNTTVHYLVSPPRRLVRRTHKPKQRFNPAGSGDTKRRALYEPRVAFLYPERRKSKSKCA
ncbi:hypothetical protein KCP69_07260 [Salmonella enterica subsp. enterica]|nr:hypothetical protein KCP69_07260 [Salmonella enterica subsp. enterica]